MNNRGVIEMAILFLIIGISVLIAGGLLPISQEVPSSPGILKQIIITQPPKTSNSMGLGTFSIETTYAPYPTPTPVFGVLPLNVTGENVITPAQGVIVFPIAGLTQCPSNNSACTSTTGSNQGSDWPTYMNDISRTGATSDTVISSSNAKNLKKLWEFQASGGIAASPVVVNNTVYVGTWDGNFYAIDANTGAMKWKEFIGVSNYPKCSGFQQNVGIASSATVFNGVVYIGGGDGNLYALDASTGRELWHTLIGNPSNGYANFASTLVYDNSLYYGTASNCDNPTVQGQLFQFDLTTHQKVNTFNVVPTGQTGGAIWTSPAIDSNTNTLYISTGNGNGYSYSIVALDASNLTLKNYWKIPDPNAVNDSDFSTTPTIFNSSSGKHLVVATNKNGIAYALNRDNLGAGPIWQVSIANGGECPECGDGSIASATYINNTLYIAGGKNNQGKGSIRAVNPDNGNMIWQQVTSDSILSSLASVNDIVVNTSGASLQVRNSTTGTLLYEYKTGAVIYGAPIIAGGKIFVGSFDKNLYAFGVPGL